MDSSFQNSLGLPPTHDCSLAYYSAGLSVILYSAARQLRKCAYCCYC